MLILLETASKHTMLTTESQRRDLGYVLWLVSTSGLSYLLLARLPELPVTFECLDGILSACLNVSR
jgi:hypothetical protein